jgi:hypothetical protein
VKTDGHDEILSLAKAFCPPALECVGVAEATSAQVEQIEPASVSAETREGSMIV